MLLAVPRHDLASAGSVPSTYWLSVAMQDAPRQHFNASQVPSTGAVFCVSPCVCGNSTAKKLVPHLQYLQCIQYSVKFQVSPTVLHCDYLDIKLQNADPIVCCLSKDHWSEGYIFIMPRDSYTVQQTPCLILHHMKVIQEQKCMKNSAV